MNGKDKCEELKRIRKEIAEQNQIEFTPSDCNHEGSCHGVCPACEKEADFILEELKKRAEAGLPIKLDVDLEKRLSQIEDNEEDLGSSDDTVMVNTDGIIPEPEILMGEPEIEQYILQGDIAAPDDFIEESEEEKNTETKK